MIMDSLEYMERGYYGAIIGDKTIVRKIWEVVKEAEEMAREEE